MATKVLGTVTSFASKAKAAVDPAAKFASTHFEAMIQKNKEYIVTDPVAKSKLGKQFVFSHLATVPQEFKAASSEWQALKTKFEKSWQNITMAEYGTYALFVGEAYAWFCVGDIMGRGFRFIDYNYE